MFPTLPVTRPFTTVVLAWILLPLLLGACRSTPESERGATELEKKMEEEAYQEAAQEKLGDSLANPQELGDSLVEAFSPEDQELTELDSALGDPEEWLAYEDEVLTAELPKDGAYLKNPVSKAEPGPTDLVRVDEDASPLNLAQIHASLDKYHRRYQPQAQGPVRLKLLIDERGVYRKHQVVTPAPTDSLQAVVEEVVQKVRYKPASYKDAPRKVWVNFEHRFAADKQRPTNQPVPSKE